MTCGSHNCGLTSHFLAWHALAHWLVSPLTSRWQLGSCTSHQLLPKLLRDLRFEMSSKLMYWFACAAAVLATSREGKNTRSRAQSSQMSSIDI